MANATTVKRLAARILGVGVSRIKLNTEHRDEIEAAARAEDVKELTKKGIITVRPFHRRKVVKDKRKRGPGKRKGTKYSRKSRKELWMERVRAQRKLLKSIESQLKPGVKRQVYLKIKGGAFKGKKSLMNYLKENDLLKG